MAALTFSELLEVHRTAEQSLAERRSEPQFRVSAGVGFVVLGLSPHKEAAAPLRRPRNYEEMMEPEIKPGLSLADLALRVERAQSAAELRRLRREYARTCHPDQFQGAGENAATSGMAAANRLIDDAIALLKKRRPAPG